MLHSHRHPGKSGNKVQSGLSISLDRSRVTGQCGKGHIFSVLFTTQGNSLFGLTVHPKLCKPGLGHQNQPSVIVLTFYLLSWGGTMI